MKSLGQKRQTRSILTESETICFVKNLFASSSSFKFYFDIQIKKHYKLRKYLVVNHISNKSEKVIASPSLQEKEGILLNQRAQVLVRK